MGGGVAGLRAFGSFFSKVFYDTLVRLPFARQHFKLIEISMMPFGKTLT